MDDAPVVKTHREGVRIAGVQREVHPQGHRVPEGQRGGGVGCRGGADRVAQGDHVGKGRVGEGGGPDHDHVVSRDVVDARADNDRSIQGRRGGQHAPPHHHVVGPPQRARGAGAHHHRGPDVGGGGGAGADHRVVRPPARARARAQERVVAAGAGGARAGADEHGVGRVQALGAGLAAHEDVAVPVPVVPSRGIAQKHVIRPVAGVIAAVPADVDVPGPADHPPSGRVAHERVERGLLHGRARAGPHEHAGHHIRHGFPGLEADGDRVVGVPGGLGRAGAHHGVVAAVEPRGRVGPRHRVHPAAADQLLARVEAQQRVGRPVDQGDVRQLLHPVGPAREVL